MWGMREDPGTISLSFDRVEGNTRDCETVQTAHTALGTRKMNHRNIRNNIQTTLDRSGFK